MQITRVHAIRPGPGQPLWTSSHGVGGRLRKRAERALKLMTNRSLHVAFGRWAAMICATHLATSETCVPGSLAPPCVPGLPAPGLTPRLGSWRPAPCAWLHGLLAWLLGSLLAPHAESSLCSLGSLGPSALRLAHLPPTHWSSPGCLLLLAPHGFLGCSLSAARGLVSWPPAASGLQWQAPWRWPGPPSPSGSPGRAPPTLRAGPSARALRSSESPA